MSDHATKKTSTKRTLVIAAILYAVDAFSGNGAIAVIMLAIVIFFFLPIAIYREAKKQNARPQFYKCIIYTVAASLVFGTNHINNKIAGNRAIELVAVIEKYKDHQGEYPNNLEALVPEYLDSVPRAKYHAMGEFRYFGGDEPFLHYVKFAPFGRPTYWFSRQQWDYVD